MQTPKGSVTLKVGTSHFLTTFEPPSKQIHSITDVIIFRKIKLKDGEIKMVPDAHHIDGRVCNFQLGIHEKVLILKVSIRYCHNESSKSYTCTLGPMFEPDPSLENPETAHPDLSGKVKFVIPGNKWAGVVNPDSSVIYEPNLVNLDINILQYAGMESHILEARSTSVGLHGISDNYTLFNVTDPLFVFLMAHKHHFPELHAGDIKKRTDTIYSVTKSLVARVQRFFQNAIFPQLHYTMMNGLLLEVDFDDISEGNLVMVQVTLDYMVISPQNYSYKTTDIKLNF